MAYGMWLEAEYESGYIHREDDQDHSPYVPGRNIFYDILHDLPGTVGNHGRLVRFSLVGDGVRYDIDWLLMPEGARPIYYRTMTRTIEQGPSEDWEDTGPQCLSHFFGYQFTDPLSGEHVEKIEEIPGGA